MPSASGGIVAYLTDGLFEDVFERDGSQQPRVIGSADLGEVGVGALHGHEHGAQRIGVAHARQRTDAAGTDGSAAPGIVALERVLEVEVADELLTATDGEA